VHRQGAGAPGLVSALGAGLLAAWALDEAIAVLGLALALLRYPREDWFLFFVVSLALLLAHRPVSRRA
jgi:membrane protein implicated in regulation of membrane protease activity